MSSQSRTTGAVSMTLTLRGVTYTLTPFRFGAYKELEKRYLQLQGDPIHEVAQRFDGLPEAQRAFWMKTAVAEAINRVPSKKELAEFEETFSGIACKLWMCMKENHPDMTPDKVEAVLESCTNAEVTEALAKIPIASGEEAVKNSDGQTASAENSTKPDSADGLKSTSPSLNDSKDGPTKP